jgi:hypothetical protein
MLGVSWLGLQAVHELGHVAAAAATGGTVRRVVVHPLTISRTEIAPNPRPLLVAWAGPIVGIALPLLSWSVAARMRLASAYLFRFFAGACLAANGGYLAAGAIHPSGDVEVLLRLGTPAWQPAVMGLSALATGLALWHGESRRFGFGGEPVNRGHAAAVVSLFLFAVLALAIRGR